MSNPEQIYDQLVESYKEGGYDAAFKETMSLDKEDIREALKWNDRNGSYDDDDYDTEGYFWGKKGLGLLIFNDIMDMVGTPQEADKAKREVESFNYTADNQAKTAGEGEEPSRLEAVPNKTSSLIIYPTKNRLRR